MKKYYLILFSLCSLTTNAQNTIDGHEYVDLGLPSGTLWATCNVGAEKPEEYGLYFAWGETTGYGSDISDGHSFDWENYKWCKGTNYTITKYCTSSIYGTVDNKVELEDDDDAAMVNWGNQWQMPSIDQINELCNTSYTTSTWVTENGIKGRLVTSKVNGNHIFLPAAGCRVDSRIDYGTSSYMADGAYYFKSLNTVNNSAAKYLIIRIDKFEVSASSRSVGRTIRPVCVQKSTAIDLTPEYFTQQQMIRKYTSDGQTIITKNGKNYNISGAEVK